MQNGTDKLTKLLGSLLVVGLIAQICSTCGPGTRRRGDLCCGSQTCKGTDFQACLTNNTQDKCVPCSPGSYLNDEYDTSYFAEPGLCVPVQDCAQDEIRNSDGVCECDRAQGYYSQGGVCILSRSLCTAAGEELNTLGTCSPCKDGFYKPSSDTSLCKKKSSCFSNQTSIEGDAKTDRHCYKAERTTTHVSTTNDTKGDTSHDIWVIIGPVAGCVIGLIVLFVGFWYFRRQRHSKKTDAKTIEEAQPLQDTHKVSTHVEHHDEGRSSQARGKVAIEHTDEELESLSTTHILEENGILDRINKAEPSDEISNKGLSKENVTVHSETNPKQYQNKPGPSGKKTHDKPWLSGYVHKSEGCENNHVDCLSEKAVNSHSETTHQNSQTYPKDYYQQPDNHNVAASCDSNEQEANVSDSPRTLNYQPHSEAENNAILPGGHQSFPLQPNGIAHNHQDGQVIEHQHDSGLPSDEPNHICGHPSHE